MAKRGRPYTVRTEEFKDIIVDAYLKGQAIHYIAGYLGIAEKTCSAILKERNIPLRTTGRRRSGGS